MTNDEIAKLILNTQKPGGAGMFWAYDTKDVGSELVITFRQKMGGGFLNIGEVLHAVQGKYEASWHHHEQQPPRLIIKGGFGGRLVEAIFDLTNPEE